MSRHVDMSQFPDGWDFEKNCTGVGPLCPIEATTYGYVPNAPVNYILTAWFALCAIVSLGIGIKGRTWSFSILVCVASALEAAGYGARIWLRSNPFNDSPVMMQLCCIILAPTLYCAAVYLTLKHMALSLGSHLSRIRPHLYSWIFLTGDVICLVIQGAGGGVAATAEDENTGKIGENLMITGVTLQVTILTIFGGFLVDFYIRARKEYARPMPGNPGYETFVDKKFRLFVKAILTAYLLIWIRCVYRIAELSQGWESKIMRDEISFIILEGFAVVLAGTVLTVAAPTFFFPQMGSGHSARSMALLKAQDASDMELNPTQEHKKHTLESRPYQGYASDVDQQTGVQAGPLSSHGVGERYEPHRYQQ